MRSAPLYITFAIAISTTLAQLDRDDERATGNCHNVVAGSYIFRQSCWTGEILAQGLTNPPHTWSYDPLCIFADRPDATLCVYTDRSFAFNRGISVIAQPHKAAQLNGHAIFRNPSLASNSNGLNTSLSGQYSVQPIPRKGLGLVAGRDIEVGTLLISESPIIAVQQDVTQILKREEDLYLLYKTAVERLPKKTRDRYMALDDGNVGLDLYWDRFETNSFNVYDFILVFPEIARINHDCRPSAYYHFDRKTFTYNVHAIRPIAAGEEISQTYINLDMDHFTRRERLEGQWGFKCTCAFCSANAASVAASDARLSRIEQLKANLSAPIPKRNASISMAEELITLHEEEQLWGPVATAYYHVALEMSYLGDDNGVSKWATKAVNVGRIWRGPEYVDKRRWSQLLVDPEAHKSWLHKTGN